MNEITWSDEDVKLVEKFIQIRNRGFYCSGEELTAVYNRVLHKRANVTMCGSCLRARITELEGALNQFKRKMALSSPSESAKENEQTTIKEEENKASTEPKKKGGRPKKKKE